MISFSGILGRVSAKEIGWGGQTIVRVIFHPDEADVKTEA